MLTASKRGRAPAALTALAALAALVALAALATWTARPAAADHFVPPSFMDVIEEAEFVAIATVAGAPPENAELMLRIDLVLKGPPVAEVRVPADDQREALRHGTRAVLAVADLASTEGPGTTVIRVLDDGGLEAPDIVDVPATLAELETMFGLAGTPIPALAESATPLTTADLPPGTGQALAMIAGVGAVLVIALAVAARGVGRRAGTPD